MYILFKPYQKPISAHFLASETKRKQFLRNQLIIFSTIVSKLFSRPCKRRIIFNPTTPLLQMQWRKLFVKLLLFQWQIDPLQLPLTSYTRTHYTLSFPNPFVRNKFKWRAFSQEPLLYGIETREDNFPNTTNWISSSPLHYILHLLTLSLPNKNLI